MVVTLRKTTLAKKRINGSFPQPLVEGLLNSRRRVSDRPSWILISKTPARKLKNVCYFFSIPQAFKAQLKAEPDFRYTNIFNLRRNPILGTQTFLT